MSRLRRRSYECLGFQERFRDDSGKPMLVVLRRDGAVLVLQWHDFVGIAGDSTFATPTATDCSSTVISRRLPRTSTLAIVANETIAKVQIRDCGRLNVATQGVRFSAGSPRSARNRSSVASATLIGATICRNREAAWAGDSICCASVSTCDHASSSERGRSQTCFRDRCSPRRLHAVHVRVR